MAVAAAIAVVATMFLVVGAHVVLTQRQFELDRMTAESQAASAQHARLELDVAQLEAPSRIVSVAEQRLHMVVPANVVYLNPAASSGTKVKQAQPASAGQAPSGG